MVVLVLTTLGTAFLYRGANESWLAYRVTSSSAALWAAEAGLQKARWEYNYNNCAGMTHLDGNTGCNGDKTLAGTLAGYGDYDVTLDSTNTNIGSTASIPSRTAAKNIQRKVVGVLGKPSIFGFGMFAQGKVTVSNNALVDAYNSTAGAYGGANVDHVNGSVGSNGTTAGVVEIDNNADVWGNVSTGPGGSVTNTGHVAGSVTNTNSIALPAVVVPGSLSGLASGGALSVGNNNAYTFNAGDYKYSSINLGNKSTVTVNGAVRLYLTGDASHTGIDTGSGQVKFDITAGSSLIIYTDGTLTFNNNATVIVASQKPKDLQIYSTYTGPSGLTLENNSSTYAAIYGPQTDVNVSNNAGLYGAVVGKTTLLNNNGDVHYDTALATMANPFEGSIISNWQDVAL
ncbi:MAG: hypothetical protein HQL17_00310 [Candidatus Omnitrophica bacterium]|nr:hypothetical protein [Candidatus Omnitrophota bacterium]